MSQIPPYLRPVDIISNKDNCMILLMSYQGMETRKTQGHPGSSKDSANRAPRTSFKIHILVKGGSMWFKNIFLIKHTELQLKIHIEMWNVYFNFLLTCETESAQPEDKLNC